MSAPQKRPTIIQNVFTGQPLINGQPNLFQDKFPKGALWYELWLELIFTVVIGTGTTPLTNGLLNAIKNVYLKSDKEGVIINACGLALAERSHKVAGTLTSIDTLAASNGSYSVFLPIQLANPCLRRPEDLGINSARTSQMDLNVTIGSLADLFGSVGTAQLAVTANVHVVTSTGPVTKSTAPKAVPYIVTIGPINPANQTYMDIERNIDLFIMDVTVFSQNSTTSGVPCSGTQADTVLTSLQFEDNLAIPFRSVTWRSLEAKNKQDYQFETVKVGEAIIDFSMDGSIYSAYPTGGKSRVQITWVNNTLSTSQITALLDGWKRLKP